MADTWQIVSQRQTERLNPAGIGFESVWEISYQITAGPAQGTVGTITVPVAMYSAEYVSELISNAVATVHDVASL